MGKISAFYAMPHPPIIIPEIGKGEEKRIKKTSDACYKVAEEIKDSKPDTLIIVTPHGPLFSDAIAVSYEVSISGGLGRFGASQVSFNCEINLPLTKKIIEYSEREQISIAKITKQSAKEYGVQYELDHGVNVPLYFINKKFSNYKIVHITYGMLPKIELYKFGMSIKKAVEESNSNAVFIASGDLSHRLTFDGPYQYSPYGEKFDKEITSLLENGDVLGAFNMDDTMIEKAGECGLRSYYIMLGAMNGNDIKGNLLSYEGTFGVGYAVIRFNLGENNEDTYHQLLQENKRRFAKKLDEEDTHVKLARESLTHYLRNGKYLKLPSYVSEELKNARRGVFVTLHKEGQLRGCIGTIFPVTNNIAEEIVRNAVEAGERDPRFLPVSEDELKEIDFSVDVLTEPEIASIEELDPKKYGVIVSSGHKTGLLLPDIEGVDTVEQQINIALQKAGISPRDNYTIEKFEVIRHGKR